MAHEQPSAHQRIPSPISSLRRACSRVAFQLVSTIGVVGRHKLWSGQNRVPEGGVGMMSVVPNGYSEAKYICERILEEPLHKYPAHFRAMTVRLG